MDKIKDAAREEIEQLQAKIKEMADNNAFYSEAGSMWADAQVFLNNHKLGTVVAFVLFIVFLMIASWL